jgi:hypothetical protein
MKFRFKTPVILKPAVAVVIISSARTAFATCMPRTAPAGYILEDVEKEVYWIGDFDPCK